MSGGGLFSSSLGGRWFKWIYSIVVCIVFVCVFVNCVRGRPDVYCVCVVVVDCLFL